MFAKLALVALAASSAVAAPISSTALNAVSAAVSLPKTLQASNATYYYQNGNAGACGLYSQDVDRVVGLPLTFYNDTGSVSPYCGSYVWIQNSATNATTYARVADASASPDILSLSVIVWDTLSLGATSDPVVNWRFANTTETAEAKAWEAAHSASSSAISATTAASTSYKAAATTTTTEAPKTTTTQAPKPTTTKKTTTTTTYEAPKTTTTQYKPTTTTTTWEAPSSTTTYQAAKSTAATYQSSSSSSSSSGSYSGDATYFYQNGVAGACGTVHSDSDYIVAMDSAMYNGGSNCGKSLTIYTSGGGSVTATVADECPTCNSAGSLDLSVAAFNAIASESQGMVSITWSWN